MPRPKLGKPFASDLRDQSDRIAAIRRTFANMREKLRSEGYQVTYRTHPNRDGSIDAELIAEIQPDEETGDTITNIADALDVAGSVPDDVQASVMLSAPPEKVTTKEGEPHPYKIKKGMAAVQTGYTRIAALAPITARVKLAERVQNLNETQVRLRLWWAPGGAHRRKDW